MRSSFVIFLLMVLIYGWMFPGNEAFTGDNLCDTSAGHKDCCHGWKRDFLGRCTVPICEGNCGISGECVGPNLCFCANGVIQYSCAVIPNLRRSASCRQNCQNGGRCVSGRCSCNHGYTGEFCERIACPNNCNQRGRCLSSGYCQCDLGFSGRSCELVMKGPCYATMNKGTCSDQITEAMLTREECCNGIGRAWGESCQACSVSSCGYGRVHQIKGRCGDFNLCNIPGICAHGTCIYTHFNNIKCNCNKGWYYNSTSKTCRQKVDMCRSNPTICGQGGICITSGNERASTHTCICHSGYKLSYDGKYCNEVRRNPCEDSTLCRNGICLAERDSYRCHCSQGYAATSNGKMCEKQTYCSVNPTVCPNGECVPVDDFYYCRCKVGYEPTRNGLDCVPNSTPRTTTQPQDVCQSQTTCKQGGRCVAISAIDYICLCQTNYDVSLSGKSCFPKQQADSPSAYKPCTIQNSCQNGKCINEVTAKKGYKCLCNPGFVSNNDHTTCMEDYCRSRSHLCLNGKCHPYGEYDFICTCHTGYKQSANWRSCELEHKPIVIDPCATIGVCNNGRCSIKYDNRGKQSVKCTCNEGYVLSQDKLSCKKVAACDRYPFACGPYGRCININMEKDYYCVCAPDFKQPSTRKNCTQTTTTMTTTIKNLMTRRPIPNTGFQALFSKTYCQTFSYVCGHGLCVDLDSSHSFKCICYKGYQATTDKRYCVKKHGSKDMDVCQQRPNVCVGTGRCLSAASSTMGYICNCYPGYKHITPDNQQICIEYDYNAITNKIVIHNPSDNNNKDSPDYSIDISDITFKQEPVLENKPLRLNTGICDILGRNVCVNGWCVEGGIRGYQCSCLPGYKQTEDKQHCTDIDECSENKDRCLNGRCVNQIGSFTCECDEGFEMNIFKVCKDIDECSRDRSSICPNGKCINLWGDYECDCLPGYRHPESDRGRKHCISQTQSAVGSPQFSIDGEVNVYQSSCPLCKFGCMTSNPQVCTCLFNQIMLKSKLCVPMKASYLKQKLASKELSIYFYLPLRNKLRNINLVSRKDKFARPCTIERKIYSIMLVRCDIVRP